MSFNFNKADIRRNSHCSNLKYTVIDSSIKDSLHIPVRSKAGLYKNESAVIEEFITILTG